MTLRRRDFIKFGGGGIAGILGTRAWACSSAPQDAVSLVSSNPLKLSVRGLCLLQRNTADHTLTVHMLDATKLGIPDHKPSLVVKVAALDVGATTVTADQIENEGTSNAIYHYHLAGKQVSFPDDPAPADLEVEPGEPPASQIQPAAYNWSSMKWIPNLAQLCGAHSANPDVPEKSACSIVLKHGHVQGGVPKSRIGPLAVWTFKKPAGSGGGTITNQAYSDTLVFTRQDGPLTPAVTIDSGRVVLRRGAAPTDIVLQNYMTTKPTGSQISLGHFDVFYSLVDKQFVPDVSVDPTVLDPCEGCDGDPVYCPPGRI